jgi:hypothetical protein
VRPIPRLTSDSMLVYVQAQVVAVGVRDQRSRGV